MTTDPLPSRIPSAAYLAATALVGFVLGAFVVASLGNGPFRRDATAGQPTASSGSGDLDKPHATTARSTAEKGTAAKGYDEAGGVAAAPAPTTGTSATGSSPDAEIKELIDRHLDIPVQGVQAAQLVRTYDDARSGGRVHEALDILAPRNTPVMAAEDGTVVRLFLSKQGGNSIYQFDPQQEYCYYYAHLERYADGLKEGDRVTKGQVIGYVGTSGNAPKDTPHLHFAIFRLGADKHWWEGTPLDPYDVLHSR
jgi:peptidoglycan LD-endopeptidase LytH